MKSESDVQALVMMRLSEMGHRIWRNNNGAAKDTSGRFIRYGLANTSAKVSARLKSSDLIGIQCGTGRLISIEVKCEGWVYKGNDHEAAQKRWLDLIIKNGGIAGFISDVHQLNDLMYSKK